MSDKLLTQVKVEWSKTVCVCVLCVLCVCDEEGGWVGQSHGSVHGVEKETTIISNNTKEKEKNTRFFFFLFSHVV